MASTFVLLRLLLPALPNPRSPVCLCRGSLACKIDFEGNTSVAEPSQSKPGKQWVTNHDTS